MQITALVENDRLPRREDLIAEHGVSLHIRWRARSLLFDTGASGAFADNAQRLRVSVAGVEHAVISHYHYDHGGGLARFVAENPEAPIHLRPLPDGVCVGCPQGGSATRGIDLDRALLREHAPRFRFVEGATEITAGAWLLTDIPRNHPLPPGNRRLCLRRTDPHADPHADRVVADPFEHELLLVLRDDDGLVVLTGCAHRGVLNMVDAARAAFPDTPIKALLGGFHLMGLPSPHIEGGTSHDVASIARALAAAPIDRIFAFHCTGDRAFQALGAVLGERLSPLPTGSVVEV